MDKKIITLIFIFIAGLAIGGAGFYLLQSQKSLPQERASKIAMDFINKAIAEQNVTASFMSIAEESGVYKIHLKIEEKEYDSFISKDGKYLFSVAFNLEEENEKETSTVQENQEVSQEPQASLESLANCLTEKGATFYGAFWCGHCQNQKKMFGEFAELLPYVECSTSDGKSQTDICKEKQITGYPTWEFSDGTRQSGEVSLQSLAEKTGCQLPQ